jgi:hypothetical protein
MSDRVKDLTKCNDYGDPDVPNCLVEPDERYTMRFDDIGEQPIRWCANCGPRAKVMDEALQAAFGERPGFGTELERAIDQVVAETRAKAH